MVQNYSWNKNGNVVYDTPEQVPLSFIEKQQRKLQALYDNITSEPLKYTGEYVKFKGKEYPEIFLPPDEYAPKFSDINTYIHQNRVENFKEKLKRYYPDYNIEVVIKNGTPRIINLER